MFYFYVALFFLFGLVFGSFFNVVGLRVPVHLPFTNDRSACPACQETLTWSELIPVMSYLMQRGKCRQCNALISIRYPLMELATGLLFVLAYVEVGLSLELMTALLCMSMLVIIFVTDIHYMIIPNKILLAFLPFFILMRLLVPLDPWYDAIIGGLVGYGLIALIILLTNGGMGAGDMKLFGVLGILLGWKLILLTFFIAVLCGAIIGLFIQHMNKTQKNEPIPFGPYIVIATVITYFYGEPLIQWYAQFL